MNKKAQAMILFGLLFAGSLFMYYSYTSNKYYETSTTELISSLKADLLILNSQNISCENEIKILSEKYSFIKSISYYIITYNNARTYLKNCSYNKLKNYKIIDNTITIIESDNKITTHTFLISEKQQTIIKAEILTKNEEKYIFKLKDI